MAAEGGTSRTRHAIIGTAGHVDHGKSAIVKALTGTDPDRLKEEKERGLTIDLGFAYLGDRAAIIDVPGHERFIKNMVAGVSTIDLVLFVVAADDGVMPQTREHLEILDLLRVRQGIVVINKIDLVEREWLDLVRDDVAELVRGTFLESAPVVCVSAVTGEGIDQLRQEIDRAIEELPERADRGVFFMPIDRAFLIKGFGTVVTGSVLSGRVKTGDRLEVQPKGVEVRVRAVQRHGKPVDGAQIAERAALNLMGIDKEGIERGDVLTEPDFYQPTEALDVRLTLLKSATRPLQHLARVRLHLGTGEYFCRVWLADRDALAPGDHCFAQLRLEEKVVANWGAPFVIRSYSPLVTIGGGVILDVYPPRHRRKDAWLLDYLQQVADLDLERALEARIRLSATQPAEVESLARYFTIHPDYLRPHLENLELRGRVMRLRRGGRDLFVHASVIEELEERLLALLQRYHEQNPLREGMNRSEAQESLARRLDPVLFEAILGRLTRAGKIEQSGGILRLAGHEVTFTREEEELRTRILSALEKAGFSPPDVKKLAPEVGVEPGRLVQLLSALEAKGEVLQLDPECYLAATVAEKAKEMLREVCREKGEITVSEFRELLGTTRRYALGLLMRFDEQGITVRVGDVRRLAE